MSFFPFYNYKMQVACDFIILQINIFNIESHKIKVYNFYYRGIVMENFYFNSSTIFKYLRKVLNEINKATIGLCETKVSYTALNFNCPVWDPK